jgi:hypothetical protein
VEEFCSCAKESRKRFPQRPLSGQRDQLVPVVAGRAARIVPANIPFVIHPMLVGVIADFISRAAFRINHVQGAEDGILATASDFVVHLRALLPVVLYSHPAFRVRA